TVGHIAGTHGIRGEVRVISRTDYPERRFASGSKLFLCHPDRKQRGLWLTVTSSRPHKSFWLLRFEEWDNVNQAEPYKGGTLMIGGEEAVGAEPDEYYLHEIVGCGVFTTDGERIGTVTDILQPGANDVWVVKRDTGGELLIPFIAPVVKDVDPEEERVTIQWMEGLE